jgi:hypothetical protein
VSYFITNTGHNTFIFKIKRYALHLYKLPAPRAGRKKSIIASLRQRTDLPLRVVGAKTDAAVVDADARSVSTIYTSTPVEPSHQCR